MMDRKGFSDGEKYIFIAIMLLISMFVLWFSKIYFNIEPYQYYEPPQIGMDSDTLQIEIITDYTQQAQTPIVIPENMDISVSDMYGLSIYIGEFDCTAYCCEEYEHICGGTGVTAAGYPQQSGITAGANFNVLPPGTWIYIEDVGIRQVQDTGPDCPSRHIDIAVETHQEALEWGLMGGHEVYVLEEYNP